MIQVRCEGCQATFDLDERRIPKSGMRVRCPKCGASFHVMPSGQTSPTAKPAVPAPTPSMMGPSVPMPTPSLSPAADVVGFGELDFSAPISAPSSDDPDLPAPASRARPVIDLPAPAGGPKGGVTDLPAPAGPKPGVVDLPRAAAPKPPTASATGPVELDLPARAVAKPGVVDLPAPASGNRGVTDLPAPAGPKPGVVDLPRAAAPRAGVVDLPRAAAPKPAARAQAPSFDDGIDLPSPSKGLVDLPARPAAAPSPLAAGDEFGELALPVAAPTPKSPTPARGIDLDALDEPPTSVAQRPVLGGGPMATDALDDPFAGTTGAAASPSLDLPTPSRSVDLPATKDLALDLPTPVASSALPAPAKRALGRVALEKRAVPASSLGAVEAELPVPSTGVGLPQSASAPLPAPAARADLPVSASLEGLPRAAPAGGQGFGELDLPVVDARKAPSPTLGGELDLDLGAPSAPRAPAAPPAGEFDLAFEPPPAKSTPAPSAAVEPARAKPAEEASRSVRGRAGGMGFGEVDLGEAEPASPAASADASLGGEFDDIRLAEPKGAEIGTVGAAAAGAIEPAIDIAVPARPDVVKTKRDRGAEADEGAKPGAKPARRGLFVGMGVVGALVIGGAAMSLTSAGPFGANLIDEQINGPARHAAAERTIRAAATQLDQDTWGQAKHALDALDAQLRRTPNEAALLAYDTYAHYLALARFGNDPAVAGRARTLFDQLNARPRNTPYAAAARAARDVGTGHPERARGVSNTDPTTRDLATLAALAGSDPQAAVETARAAQENHPTPRARFLYARALYVADDLAGAREQAEALLAAQPGHAGARLVLARVLSARVDGRDRAVIIAHEVEDMNQDASVDERTEAAVLIGQIELARDRVTPAREAFERALALDPRSAEALIGTARILYRQSSYTDALARFQAAQTADPDDLDARIGYAMTSLALGRAPDARATLEPLLHDHGGDANLHYWLAKALLAVNQPADAEREFREAIRLDNTNLDAYTTLAAMLFSQQRPEAAEQVLEEARAHVSDQSAIHRALGEQRAARGDLAGAEGELRQAVAAHNDDVRSHFLLGQVLRRERRFDDAARELATVAHIDADYPGLSLERGSLAEARGDAAGALAMFRDALSREPQNADLIVRVASALIATGQYADADTQMTRFVADHPNVAEAQYVLGRAKLAEGDTTDALRLLERATELDATRADYQAYAAEVNLLRASYPLALRHANTAIELDPSYARGYQVRGEIESRQGAVREALVDANRALSLDPTMPEAMVTLADADEGLGHAPEGIILYRRALALRPTMGEWHARLGRMLGDAGHGAEAVSELERAASLGDPQNPPPAWLAPAHRQLGDLLRDQNPARARQHYQRFLDLSPPNAPGASDVRNALAELGH